MDKIIMMKFEKSEPSDFKNPKILVSDGKFEIKMISLLANYLRSKCPLNKLFLIIFEFLGKMPDCTDRSILSELAARLIYTEHYNKIHETNSIPDRVIERTDEITKSIHYISKEEYDKKMEFRQTDMQNKANARIDIDTLKQLKEMSFDQLIEWEKQLGVPLDIIEEQMMRRQKNPGLASMQAKVKIKSILKENHQ